MRITLLRKTLALLTFLLFGVSTFTVEAKAYETNDPLMPHMRYLVEVLEELSEKYQVIFSFDADLLAEVKIEFEIKSEERLEVAINRLLAKTNLRYKYLGSKYYVIFPEHQTNGKQIRKLERKFRQIQQLEEEAGMDVQIAGKISTKRVKAISKSVQELQSLEQTIKGEVKDEAGNKLVGATVRAKETNQGTLTDEGGNYELTVSDEVTTLVVSYLGYITQEILIEGRTTIDITLDENVSSLEEVVVVGYGTQRKADITGAIGSVSKELLNNTTFASTGALLQGKVAGVRVETNGGAPGAGVNIVIRGTGTFGNDQPLYVVDGNIVESINFINPNDIQSVEILKDASAAAIYGNRAANGVVLVTTKKGQAGEILINFDVKLGAQTPTNTFDFLNAREYADYRNAANDNDGDPRAVPNDTGFDPTIDTDWQDLSLNTALYQDYNVSVSGGGQNSTYYISGQFLDQEGIVVDSDFKRYNIRANSTFSKGIFSMQQNLAIIREVNNPNTFFGENVGKFPPSRYLMKTI